MPLSVRIGVTVILLALAVALAVTVARSRAGRLRRSGLSGVRTPSALVDDRAFERANRAALPFLTADAILAAVLAVLTAATGLRSIGGSATLLVGGVLLGALLVLGGLRGERAARNGLTPGAAPPPRSGQRAPRSGQRGRGATPGARGGRPTTRGGKPGTRDGRPAAGSGRPRGRQR